ncbi:MAG: UDP-3-O-(3-hydroxymyristoyl)glucosamine N-acyltransferase [Chitinispirillaceae bacterium]|nr:UDP-3-O-(3-hydroxymyristoyl)glucosamine N-acyltransferase [Chitinispirillaceae bacterium]
MRLSQITAALGLPPPADGGDREVHAITSPAQATGNDIIFSVDARFDDAVSASDAGIVIVKKGRGFPGKICLEVDDPYLGYARVAQLFEDCTPPFGSGISPTAIIDSSATIAPTAAIGPGTVIGAGVSIGAASRIGARCVIEKNSSVGADCRIDSGVTIRYGTTIGARVIIQSGAVIGSDGFGNARHNGAWVRIPPFGNVKIEDDAEIGANTTIDRGNFEDTIIGRGVKLDNLIHIAHNVTVGEDTVMAAQTGISGSTRVGKRVIIAGQVGFVGHIDIGDDSFIGAKAGVSKAVEPGAKITGYPARDLMTMRRIEAAQAQLPTLIKEMKSLKMRIDSIDAAAYSNNTTGGKGPTTEKQS